MHLSKASHVMEALSTNDANAKLQEGWKLVAVVVTTHPNGQLHPCYVLGKSDEHNGLTDSDTTDSK